jgi:hypothetical protein
MAQGIKAVKYIGIADVRRISDDDWRAIGVRMQGDLEWSKLNGFTVLGDRLRDGAVKYLETDLDFAVIREDE